MADLGGSMCRHVPVRGREAIPVLAPTSRRVRRALVVRAAPGRHTSTHATVLLGGATTLWRQVGTALWGVRALNKRHTEIENTLMVGLGAEAHAGHRRRAAAARGRRQRDGAAHPARA